MSLDGVDLPLGEYCTGLPSLLNDLLDLADPYADPGGDAICIALTELGLLNGGRGVERDAGMKSSSPS